MPDTSTCPECAATPTRPHRPWCGIKYPPLEKVTIEIERRSLGMIGLALEEWEGIAKEFDDEDGRREWQDAVDACGDFDRALEALIEN